MPFTILPRKEENLLKMSTYGLTCHLGPIPSSEYMMYCSSTDHLTPDTTRHHKNQAEIDVVGPTNNYSSTTVLRMKKKSENALRITVSTQ